MFRGEPTRFASCNSTIIYWRHCQMHCIIMMTWCMQVKVVTSVEERRRILRSCHSDPTSGHFGVTKTFR